HQPGSGRNPSDSWRHSSANKKGREQVKPSTKNDLPVSLAPALRWLAVCLRQLARTHYHYPVILWLGLRPLRLNPRRAGPGFRVLHIQCLRDLHDRDSPVKLRHQNAEVINDCCQKLFSVSPDPLFLALLNLLCEHAVHIRVEREDRVWRQSGDCRQTRHGCQDGSAFPSLSSSPTVRSSRVSTHFSKPFLPPGWPRACQAIHIVSSLPPTLASSAPYFRSAASSVAGRPMLTDSDCPSL